MGDERKPQGDWQFKEGSWENWFLLVNGFHYSIFHNGSLGWSCPQYDERFETLDAAKISVEDHLRARAERTLRAIGLPPLGEVIEGFNLTAGGTLFLGPMVDGEWEAKLRDVVDRIGISAIERRHTPDIAIRDVAARWKEARDDQAT